MAYFSNFPEVEYPSFLNDRVSDSDYLLIKNIFRRIKVRDDILKNISVFDEYEIRSNERPDMVANNYYGDSGLDWLVLIANNITNIRNQWPISDQELYDYCVDKYGDNISDNRFYETTEVRDSEDRLILPAGIVVDSDFTITNPDNPNSTLNPVTGITNYEYETRLNDQKRSINLLRTEYVQQAINDIREELVYSRSSQYISDTKIRSDNTRLKGS